MKIIRKNELTASRWSGGTTTELFLLPETASYADRNFDVRISTATVETDVSAFTPLPGYERILVVLDGTLVLQHEVNGKVSETTLEAYGQSAFSGSWKTTGYGRVTDFNIFFTSDFSAKAEVCELAEGQPFRLETGIAVRVVFVLAGALSCNGSACAAGDAVIVNEESEVEIVGLQQAVCVVATVSRAEQQL